MQVEQAKSREDGEVPVFEVEVVDVDEQTVQLRYIGESAEKADRTQAALDFILRALADSGGSLPRKDLIDLAKVEGISERTLHVAFTEGIAAGELSKTKHGKTVTYSRPEPGLALE